MSRNDEEIIVRVDSEIEDLVPGYLENRRKDIITIRAALGNGDFDAIRVIGHSMKGSGGGYGFDKITELGRSIELAARGCNHEDIVKFLDELLVYLERIVIVYEQV